jgi:hypothetical protein
MKVWWLLILAALLLLWSLRESFTTYEEALKDVGQTAGYTSLEPKCPEGSTLIADKTKCRFTDPAKPDVTPTCSSDKLIFENGVCKPASSNTAGAPPGTAATTPASQSSTGGSSTSSFGPNSGGSTGGNRRNQVFGPGSGGRGEGNVVPMDSSKTNQYPELMGGGDNKPSTRIEGGGIVAPSKNWQLTMDGSLPSDASLGATENSKYLPFSRQPGDMDLIPDPYRVSQQFSAASYSFKTEPSPFLTDFSAFNR